MRTNCSGPWRARTLAGLLAPTCALLTCALTPQSSFAAVRGSETPAHDGPRAQDGQPAQDGVPDGAAAVIDGQVAITMDAYKEHLLRIYGRAPLQDLLYQVLLDRELATLNLAVDPAAVSAEVDERWQRYVDIRHQGNMDAVVAELERGGYTVDSYRGLMSIEARQRMGEDAVILATREVTEEQILERFERDHGLGGVAVEVRHLFLNRARLTKDLEREGVDVDGLGPAELQRRLVERARELAAEVAAGADFETLARQRSHDLSVGQNGGLIPNYNYRRYGEPFAEAVRAAPVGVVQGPVESASGVHLIRVESRTVTTMDEVREKLKAALAVEQPSFAERGALRARLFAAVSIETF